MSVPATFLDRDALENALDEVAPVVEDLLGARGLRDGLDVRATEDIEAVARELEAFVGEPAARWNTAFAARARDVLGLGPGAVYDPFGNVVHLNAEVSRRLGHEALKLTLAHELVHVAQFRGHAGLTPMLLTALRVLRRAAIRGAPEADREGLLHAHAFLANLEGYAYHVEQDFLRALYPCAMPSEQSGVVPALIVRAAETVDALVRRLAGSVAAPDGDVLAQLLAAGPDVTVAIQHACGREHYVALQQVERPAAFDPEATELIAARLPEMFVRTIGTS